MVSVKKNLFILFVLIAMLLAACSSKQTNSSKVSDGKENKPQWNQDLTALIEGAKKEGALQLTWSSNTLGGNDGAKKIQDGLNKMFGTNINIKFTPGPAYAQVGNQIATEYLAKQPAVSDVFVGAVAQMAPLYQQDIFEKIDWTKFLPDRIIPEATDTGFALKIGTGTSGIIYNKDLLPNGKVPETMEDLLRPEWKGKIASTAYAAGFDLLLAEEMWGAKKTVEYINKFSDQVSGLIRCGEEERIANKEFAAFAMSCTGQDAIKWAEKGAPIGQVIPKDAAQFRYYYLAIPKNSSHPNAAKLFSVFMLTEEGQKLAWDTWKIDLHYLKNSHMKEIIEPLEKSGVKFFAPSIQWVVDHPEINKTKEQIIEILQKKSK